MSVSVAYSMWSTIVTNTFTASGGLGLEDGEVKHGVAVRKLIFTHPDQLHIRQNRRSCV